jgi:hypothetical protein
MGAQHHMLIAHLSPVGIPTIVNLAALREDIFGIKTLTRHPDRGYEGIGPLGESR